MDISKRKFASVLTIAVLAATLLTAIVIHAATPTTTFTIYSGNYPAAPDYTIYSDGSNYFAKNALGTNVYSGSDAADVIQDAVDSAGAGGNVFVTAGEYALSTTLDLSYDNLTFYGTGRSSKLLPSHGGNVLSVNGTGTADADRVQGVTIEGLFFRGHGGSQGDTDKANIQMKYVWRCFIRDIFMYGACGNGIWVHYGWVMQITDIIITDPNGHGIYGNVYVDSLISQVDAYGCGCSGIQLTSSGTTTITGCLFTTNIQRGMYLYDSNEVVIVGCQIFDNNFVAPANVYDGILLASDSDFNTIVGNFFRGEYEKYHLRIDSGCDNNTIVGNSIVRPAYTAQLINNGANNTVASNTGYP